MVDAHAEARAASRADFVFEGEWTTADDDEWAELEAHDAAESFAVAAADAESQNGV
jgi:hypothetical protein